MEKHRKKFILTFAASGTVILAVLVFLSSANVRKTIPKTESFASDANPVDPEKHEQIDIVSPDGKYTLTLKNVKNTNGFTQTFFTSSEKDKTPHQIFEYTSNPDAAILIPFNTFSPDNKYIFLKFGNSEKPEYLVLRTDGQNIKGDQKTVEPVSSFAEKYPDFVITEATGWGGNNLIVVNTDDKEGNIGPSWWFDLSNFSFMKLSNRFN